MRDKVVAVIPCYRESKYIADIVRRTKPYVDTVVVADDRSLDGTKSQAEEAGAEVVQPAQTAQRGVGNNTWCGIWHALRSGADIIVTLDGDGQHDPDDIPILVQAVKDGADVVVGTRIAGRAISMPKLNKAGNVILTSIGNIGARRDQRISDNQCGFRAFSAEAFKHIRTTETRFGFIVEVVIKARKAGLAITERPVKCIYRESPFSFVEKIQYLCRGACLGVQTLRWILWERTGI